MVAQRATAQSSDQGLPTPVLNNEISATIAPLDLGDSRLTRHYYAFEGTPGDLIITLNSRNLNGDMDVFTAITFRPLMKISLFANTIPPDVTKSLYLRTKQILILRIEARTPNDDAGAYRVTFGGSFAPFSGGIAVAENSEPATETGRTDRNTKRVSSVGARIDEPAAEASPSPEAKPAETKPVEEKPAEETAAAAKPKPKPRSPRAAPRNARVRPPRPKPAAKPAESDTAPSTPGEVKETPKEGDEKPPAPKPEVQEPALPQPGAHLVIEEKDGTKIDRPMSTVRRVVVEGGMIVIVLKTGKIERVPMTTVLRMSIEPAN